MYDAVIVGARLAGSTTGLLLARAGLDVLIIDRARFPSDTLSSHQLQVPGGARLARWGLLDEIIAAGTPPVAEARFETFAGTRLDGRFPTVEGVSAVYSPRRSRLDSLLVHAAGDAGAEIWEGAMLEEVTREDGRVSGIRFAIKGGTTKTVRARVLVGADGKNSTVARLVGADSSRQQPAQTLACYTYWSGVKLDRGWMTSRQGMAVGVWPTDDDLVVTYLAQPASEIAHYRSNPERALTRALACTGELGGLVLSGQRAERLRATTDLPNRIRRSSGPGWVLVGDAGLVMDPITGHGMGHALRDAELASAAIRAGLGGPKHLRSALEAYVTRRDRETGGIFDTTVGLARLAPLTVAEETLFAAIASDPVEADLFLSVLTGASPPSRLYSPRHLDKLLGPGGTARLLASHRRPSRPRPVRPGRHSS